MTSKDIELGINIASGKKQNIILTVSLCTFLTVIGTTWWLSSLYTKAWMNLEALNKCQVETKTKIECIDNRVYVTEKAIAIHDEIIKRDK